MKVSPDRLKKAFDYLTEYEDYESMLEYLSSCQHDLYMSCLTNKGIGFHQLPENQKEYFRDRIRKFVYLISDEPSLRFGQEWSLVERNN